MESIMTCISCPKGCQLHVYHEGNSVQEVSGNRCRHGKDYAVAEIEDPRRVLTSTVLVRNAVIPLVPVRSRQAIPREQIVQAMSLLRNVAVAAPVARGDVIINNLLGTGVDIIACRTLPQADLSSKRDSPQDSEDKG